MKNKKGIFVMGTIGIIYLVLIIGILALLIWFGFKISAGISSVADFLSENWMWISLAIAGLVFHKQIVAIVNFILKKFGIPIK